MGQDFRKEEELFRFIYEEGNAYSKHQLASLLGMTDHHFDKFYRSFKKELEEQHPEYLLSSKWKKEIFHRFKYDAYQFDRNILISMYRKNKFQKSVETNRLIQIIRTLADEPHTLPDLVEFLEGDEEKRKTSYQRSLDYLMELKVIKKNDQKYSLDHSILEVLEDEEIVDLFYFVHFKSNLHLLSVPGYLLLDFLSLYLSQRFPNKEFEFIWYRFINFSRVLSEYKCYELLNAINNRAMITFRYYGKKHKQKASTRNQAGNNPSVVQLIPLFLLFDHQYGRWYLIGKNPAYDISIYKLEMISDIETTNTIDEETFTNEREKVVGRLETSWLVSDHEKVEVKLRFYFDPERTDSRINFIEQRVMKEKQWGSLTPESENSFLFTISVNGVQEIKPWILSFGSSVEVISPDHLRQEIMDEWSIILKEYDPNV